MTYHTTRDSDKVPDFVVIGAAKAGTTSLCKMLSFHPDIYISTPKEPEFFARDDKYAEGMESYSALFSEATADQICGEGSTLYSLSEAFPKTVSRMHHHVPNAKLIYVVRNPIDRAYSYYVQLVKNRQNDTGDYNISHSFEDCLNAEGVEFDGSTFFASFDNHLPAKASLFTDGSHYLRQINAYLAHFPISQMLFLDFDELTQNPALSLEKVCHFIGADFKRLDSEAIGVRENISSDHFGEIQRQVAIQEAKSRTGPLSDLSKILPSKLRSTLRQLYLSYFVKSGANDGLPEPMKPETRARLAKDLLADRAVLSKLTKLDLAHWR